MYAIEAGSRPRRRETKPYRSTRRKTGPEVIFAALSQVLSARTGQMDLSLAYGIPTSRPAPSWSVLLRRKVQTTPRSEERRVGKECRSRWSPYQYKKGQTR